MNVLAIEFILYILYGGTPESNCKWADSLIRG
jgi:hypothetical protein